MMTSIIRVYKRGIIALPKEIRDKAGIREGMKLVAEAKEGKIILKPLDLWWRVWESNKGGRYIRDYGHELRRVAEEG